jgi:hypothetical protein
LRTLCPAVALTNASATSIGYPSISVALFKSLQSMHTRSLPFFVNRIYVWNPLGVLTLPNKNSFE